jgi:hypothetical protein
MKPMINRMTLTNNRLMLGGAALAAAAFLFNLRDAIALVVGHFHITMATAFVIVSLILEGSAWLMWVFPYMIPVEVTVQILVAIYGITFAAAW